MSKATQVTDRELACIVLAAGRGSRMKSRLPKVLHPIAGEAMLGHVLRAVAPLAPERVVLVVGHEAEQVAAFAQPHRCVIQAEPRGTADAVKAARGALAGFGGNVLVLYGDMPLITTDSLRRLLLARRAPDNPAVAQLGMRPRDPGAYGRLITGPEGLERIVEALDATEEERRVDLVNAGPLAADGTSLFDLLDCIGSDNAKGEFYLTDLVKAAREAGRLCTVVEAGAEEAFGVNSRAELAQAEAMLQARLRGEAMAAGATLLDPETTYFSMDTRLGRDVTVGPNVVFGPGVTVEDDVEIRAFCHLEGVTIREHAAVGPFARLRPGTVIGSHAHVGNFVEVKNSTLGQGVKAGHLTYLGDAEIGAETNIGAGTVTCNYDGFAKNRTTVGERAFIGSNATLVAPVVVGAGSLVAAGSTITRDVAADAMSFGRAQQADKPGKAARYRELRARGRRRVPKFCLLFDLDGTLVDTDPLHFAAFREFLGEHGRQIEVDDFHNIIMGNPNARIMSHYFPNEPVDTHRQFADEKEALFRSMVRELEPTLGLGALLDWAGTHGCPFAIVTNAPRRNAELMLSALGLAERFDHLIIAEELAHGKPHPLPYLTGLERLGGLAAHAIAFEDSVSGVKAAVAAGIHTVAIRTTLPDQALLEAGASLIVQDFRDPRLLAWLEQRLEA